MAPLLAPISPRLFGTVFSVIFVAELPDKTAVAAMVLATRLRALPVLLGAAIALFIQSVIAVAAGTLLARLPPAVIHIGSGLLFIGCGLVMGLRKIEAQEAKRSELAEKTGFWKTLWTVFVVVFVAEWGDLTQIGTAGFQARYHEWPTILLASCLALWSVSVLAVFVGNRAGKLLDPVVTRKIAAVVFILIGAVILVGVR